MQKNIKVMLIGLPIAAVGGFIASKGSILFQVATLLACLALIAVLSIYFAFPQIMLDIVNGIAEKQAGLITKSLQIDGYEIPYFEGGKGETLLLLHGLGVDKTNFHPMLKLMTARYHVIVPDIPGFGQTERQPDRNHSIHSQVEMILQFVKQKNLTEFYLGGNSMGGHISAAFTLAHPQYVKKLIILNSPGMLEPKAKTPYVLVEKPIGNYAEFDAEMSKVFANTPSIPGPIKDMYIADSAKYLDWNNNIVRQIREGEDHDLTHSAKEIKQPTLIIWGKQDQIVDLSVGEAYAREIPNATLTVFDPAGHAPQYEIPEKAAAAIIDFLNEA